MDRFRQARYTFRFPSPRVLRPRLIVAVAWITSLLIVYHCCRFVTDKVYVDIERALIQPKESPPLLGYLLLLRFYTSVSKEKETFSTVKATEKYSIDNIKQKLDKHKCVIYNFHEEIPKLNYSTVLPYIPICRHKKEPGILTLFTTMYDRTDKMFIFNNTVHMWPQVKGVKPVLFVTPNDSSSAMINLVHSACNQGWDVLVAPHCNNDSYPVLRSMWQVILHNYDTFFYGYTNGDIIFDNTLPLTLSHLISQDPHIFRRKHLISGQRHNVFIQNNTVIGNMEDVHSYLYNASLHTGIATDYFITTKKGFPWHSIPAFVIGRPQFDNWLIWNSSLDASVMDIDATESILALHQGLVGTIASWSETNVSVRFNTDIAKEDPNFSVLHGCTYCMNYRLMNTITSILVVPRQVERRKYTCVVDGEEHIAFLQLRTSDEALLTAYSKTVLTLDANIINIIKAAAGKEKSKL